jgi:hypothetical protein
VAGLLTVFQPIAKNALTILINISHDSEILENLATDDAFLETLLKKITVCRSNLLPHNSARDDDGGESTSYDRIRLMIFFVPEP